MVSVLQVFDVLASILTIVSLNLVVKSYKYWLLYIVGCIFFVIVCASNHIWGLTCMGGLLFLTGIKNYYFGRKQETHV